MHASQVIKMIEWHMQMRKDGKPMRLVPMILSAPGVGKSSVVYQASSNAGVNIIEFRPANHGIEDLIGLPNFTQDEKGRTRSSFATPDWLPNEERDGKYGILFIDEMPQAQLSMQNALSQLILDHKIHDYELPKGWQIVCAGNRTQDRAGTTKTPSQLNNRIRFIDMEFSVEEWINWAISTKVRPELIGFAKFRPSTIDPRNFDPARQVNCTPRSFADSEGVIDAPEELRFSLLKGGIGEGEAAEFEAFLRVYQNLPAFEDILANPTNIQVDMSKPDIVCALQTMLAHNVDGKTADKVDKFVQRMPADHQAAYYQDALRVKRKELVVSDAFSRFLDENGELLA